MNVLNTIKRRSQDYERGHEVGFRKGVEIAVRVIMFGVVQYLGDKRGWKRERIFEALQWLHKYAQMQIEDLTTFNEVVEAVREEYGIICDDDGRFFIQSEV